MDPYLGELRIFPYGFVPKGWQACNGQILPIQQNTALFSILGIVYGGNGTNTFALPDLRGRVPVHFSPSTILGAPGGTSASTLTAADLPAHSHLLAVNNTAVANEASASGYLLASTSDNEYTAKGSNTLVPMATTSIGPTGGSLPVTNIQPYLGLQICIAMQGLYPSRN